MTVDEAKALLKLQGWELIQSTTPTLTGSDRPIWRIEDGQGRRYSVAMVDNTPADDVYAMALDTIEWVDANRPPEPDDKAWRG
jgi:hypothetical protein